ncbi:tetratricopeptide repeat protein [Helicobacter bizzozeronii]|uniref:tetratricopeptide repeat protein n=1 Tax=Helicobacter bizzozeronii TaxID=56877 RepID=UPI000CF0DB2F|nr:SEL1-like repeat protein [Helicobacter bizzozeronii]
MFKTLEKFWLCAGLVVFLSTGLLWAGGSQYNAMGDKAYEAGDYDQAFEYYQKAAELENAWANYSLGYMYENGQGVDKDYDQAFDYYEKTIRMGNTRASGASYFELAKIVHARSGCRYELP